MSFVLVVNVKGGTLVDREQFPSRTVVKGWGGGGVGLPVFNGSGRRYAERQLRAGWRVCMYLM